jgi:hypothetical protein
MAKKAKKKSAAKKAKKVKRSKAKVKTPVGKKAKAAKKKPARKAAKRRSAPKKKKAEPKTITQRIASAVKSVVSTAEETNELRNRLEPPGVSETQ